MKVFRKIRKISLNKKRILNYLGYSVGEIILVVIGILIAVSLNNWNEKEQEKKQLNNIFTAVKKDLENDIEEIDNILTYHANLEPMFSKILHDSLTKEDYLKTDRLLYLILGYPEVSFDKRGFNLLSTYNSNLSNKQDSLVSYTIDFYTERLFEIKVDDDARAKDFNDNFNHWKNNYNWWSTYIAREDFDGFIEYALNDLDYKNRVATYHFINYIIFLPELELFKEKALKILKAIDKRIL